MALTIQMLKPGIIVVTLSTHVDHAFERRELSREEKTTKSGAKITKLETELQVDFPEEYEAAQKLRGKINSLIRGCCARSNFGLICPPENLGDLEKAVEEMNTLLAEWKKANKNIGVRAYVGCSQPATDSQAWAKGIADEVQELMAMMEKGIAGADVEAIREAANRAKQLGAVLDEEKAATLDAAVEAARKAARTIVKEVEKKGENATEVIRTLKGQKKAVEMARFAFMAILEDEQPGEPTEKLPQAKPRQLDLDV